MGNLKLILFPQGKLVPSGAHLYSSLDLVLVSAKAVHTMSRACFALSLGLEMFFNTYLCLPLFLSIYILFFELLIAIFIFVGMPKLPKINSHVGERV